MSAAMTDPRIVECAKALCWRRRPYSWPKCPCENGICQNLNGAISEPEARAVILKWLEQPASEKMVETINRANADMLASKIYLWKTADFYAAMTKQAKKEIGGDGG